MKSNAHQAIRAVFGQWFSAMESGDVDLALSLVAGDVIHVNPSGERRVGRAQLREALLAFHRMYVERVQWTVEKITIAGQHADVLVRETATIRPRDGSASFRVSGFHVARVSAVPGGAWLIEEDIAESAGEPLPVPHEFELDEPTTPGDSGAA